MIFTEEPRQLDWEPAPPKPAPVVQAFVTAPQPIKPVQQVIAKPVVVEKEFVRKRKFHHNGHVAKKERDLTKEEKLRVRMFFEVRNGQLEPDECVTLMNEMPKDLTVFQITGTVSRLHKLALEGSKWITIRDRAAYLSWRRRPESRTLVDYAGLAEQINLDQEPKIVSFKRGYHK